jgi:hypothetical protein
LTFGALPQTGGSPIMRTRKRVSQSLGGQIMKTLCTRKDCGKLNFTAREMGRAVALALFMWQLGYCMPAFAAERENTSAVLKFDRAEYMKATSAGQKKAEPAVKGDLCFDTARKRIEFRCGDNVPTFSVSYDSIKSLLYEQADKPRYTEAVLISPIFLLSHSKKHYLTIQYTDSAGTGQFLIVHLDKKNAREAIAAAESQTGKAVERVEEK